MRSLTAGIWIVLFFSAYTNEGADTDKLTSVGPPFRCVECKYHPNDQIMFVGISMVNI